jgi:diaminopimelate decarboxylase
VSSVASLPEVVEPGIAEPSIAELIAARPQLSLHALDGLCLDGQPLAAIADVLGTPTWVYAAPTLRRRYAALSSALSEAGLNAHIHYAVKANDRLAVLRVFAALGASADVVSGGELQRAVEAGVPPAAIVFSGVGKTMPELDLALALGVGQINVESAEELAMLSARAAALDKPVTVALRVNPDVDAGTHAKITTGRADNKFGVPYAEAPALYAHAASLRPIKLVGIALHIGSQIVAAAPFRSAFQRAAELVRGLRGRGLDVAMVDCGGGLGIGYRDDDGASPAVFAGAIRAALGGLGLRIVVEPGRWLAGPAGVLMASVILVKRAPRRPVMVLDAAMNDLVRPSMYDAWHGIVPLSPVDAVRPAAAIDVVGPVCESGDTFARGRRLPPLAPGARVALLDAGAYGSVMSSTYNTRPLAAEVLTDEVRGRPRWQVIRPRQATAAMWANERMPDWFR